MEARCAALGIELGLQVGADLVPLHVALRPPKGDKRRSGPCSSTGSEVNAPSHCSRSAGPCFGHDKWSPSRSEYRTSVTVVGASLASVTCIGNIRPRSCANARG